MLLEMDSSPAKVDHVFGCCRVNTSVFVDSKHFELYLYSYQLKNFHYLDASISGVTISSSSSSVHLNRYQQELLEHILSVVVAYFSSL